MQGVARSLLRRASLRGAGVARGWAGRRVGEAGCRDVAVRAAGSNIAVLVSNAAEYGISFGDSSMEMLGDTTGAPDISFMTATKWQPSPASK